MDKKSTKSLMRKHKAAHVTVLGQQNSPEQARDLRSLPTAVWAAIHLYVSTRSHTHIHIHTCACSHAHAHIEIGVTHDIQACARECLRYVPPTTNPLVPCEAVDDSCSCPGSYKHGSHQFSNFKFPRMCKQSALSQLPALLCLIIN